MPMLCLNDTMDQLTMANSVHWYDYMLRKEDGLVLMSAFSFAVMCKCGKGCLE